MNIFNKNKKLYDKNMLSEQDIDTTDVVNKKDVIILNPVSRVNVNRQKYNLIIRHLDYLQNVVNYEWSNLPEPYTSELLEGMIYKRPALAMFNVLNKQIILPFVEREFRNILNYPTKIRPIPYNSSGLYEENKTLSIFKDFDLDVDIFGDSNNKNDAVILYDTQPFIEGGRPISKFALNSVLIEDMAEVLARIHINLVVSNKKLLFHCKDPKQAKIMSEELDKIYNSDSPFGVVYAPYEKSDNQETSDYNVDQLFNTLKNYDSLRCLLSGIDSSSFGVNKKERLITGELDGFQSQVDAVKEHGLRLRQNFCDLCNKKFGLNMSVKIRENKDINNISNEGGDNNDV